MKLPIIHKYYTVNIFVYLLLINLCNVIFLTTIEVFMPQMPKFLQGLNLTLLILFIIELLILIPINVVLIIVEFILRKFKKLKQHLIIDASLKQQLIIYTLSILSVICSYKFLELTSAMD